MKPSWQIMIIVSLSQGPLSACDRVMSRWDHVTTTLPPAASATAGDPKTNTDPMTSDPSHTDPTDNNHTDTDTTTTADLPLITLGANASADTTLTRQATLSKPAPAGTSYAWTQVAGPGTILFTTPQALSTDLSASVDGTYTIRFTLSAADGRNRSQEFQLLWDTASPTAPSLLLLQSLGVDTLNARTSSLTLSWTAASDSGTGVASYHVDVYHATSCSGAPFQQEDLTGTSLVVNSLTDTTVVSYKVTAVDGLLHDTVSACSHDTTIDLTPPPAIAPLTATAAPQVGQVNVTVNFTGTTSDVESVDIRRQVSATAPSDCASGTLVKHYQAPSIPVISDNFTDETYAAGSAVSYRACISDKAGNSTTNNTTHVGENITSKPHILFVTSSTHTGNLGGVSGADAICTSLAAGSAITGIQEETDWKAVLSDATLSAQARLSVTGIVNYPDPVITLAASRTVFWGGTLAAPANNDETGGLSFTTAWTGSLASGATSPNHCNNWTSASSGVNGQQGDPSSEPIWLADGTATCDGSLALYCLSQFPSHPFTSFTATTAAAASAIDLSIGLPTAAIPAYATVLIKRLAGATPPAADCSDGTEVLRTSNLSPPTLSHSDNGATPAGSLHSYRVCALDPFGSVLDSRTASATSGP